MDKPEQRLIFLRFVAATLSNGFAYSAQCASGSVALCGPAGVMFPLWPAKADADQCISVYWPGLRPLRITLRQLLIRLPILAVHGVPAGIGLADHEEGILVPATTLRDALASEHAA